MNQLGLTDVASLEPDELVIEGLDVDAALAATKARGEKLIRRRKLIRISSIVSSVLVLVLSIGVFALIANNTDSPTRVRTANRVETPEPTVTSTVAPTTAVPTTVARAQKIVPTDVSIRHFGDESLCTPPPSVFEPDPNTGIALGTTHSLETFNAQAGSTYNVMTTSGSTIELIARTSNSAPGGIYIDLNSGYSHNGYARISTMGFTYCEAGMKLVINNVANGYALDITRW